MKEFKLILIGFGIDLPFQVQLFLTDQVRKGNDSVRKGSELVKKAETKKHNPVLLKQK